MIPLPLYIPVLILLACNAGWWLGTVIKDNTHGLRCALSFVALAGWFVAFGVGRG